MKQNNPFLNKKFLIPFSLLTMVLLIYRAPNFLNNENQSLSSRQLQQTSRQETIEICTNKDDNSTYGFTKSLIGISVTVSGYIQATQSDQEVNQDILAVINGDSSRTQDYAINRLAPYLIFGVFGILTLIFWIVYCVCCCKQCLCCLKKEERLEGGCSCRTISLLLYVVWCVGVIICCILGFIYSVPVVQSLKGIGCNLLYLYYDILEGELKTTTPRWIGVNGVVEKLSQTINELEYIKNNYRRTFNRIDTNWTENATENFRENLTDLYQNVREDTLSNPNPAASTNGGVSRVTPIYIEVNTINLLDLRTI